MHGIIITDLVNRYDFESRVFGGERSAEYIDTCGQVCDRIFFNGDGLSERDGKADLVENHRHAGIDLVVDAVAGVAGATHQDFSYRATAVDNSRVGRHRARAVFSDRRAQRGAGDKKSCGIAGQDTGERRSILQHIALGLTQLIAFDRTSTSRFAGFDRNQAHGLCLEEG